MTALTFDSLSRLALTATSLSGTSDLIPTTGEGSPVSPATFAAAKDGSFKGGPAITDNIPQRIVDPATGLATVLRDPATNAPITGTSAPVDTVFAQSTRGENSLWDLADVLDLPGITFNTPAKETIDDAVKKNYTSVIGKKTATPVQTLEAATRIVTDEIEAIVPTMSSWTLSHRHVDGVIRSATDADGNVIWHDGGEVYNKLAAAGPRNLRGLLFFSPNSILFGYWASTLPIRHRLARNFTSTVTGYGARRLLGGSTKATPFDISSRLEVRDTGDVRYLDGKTISEKLRPSNWGLGAVPTSGATNQIVCDTIIGDAAVATAQLRRVLRGSTDLTDEQADAATVALTALGLLAHILILENGFYRSGCDLIDRSTVWHSLNRGGASEVIDLPATSAEMIPVVKEALDAARSVDAFGSATDRIAVDMGPTMLNAVAASYLEQLVKKAEAGEA
ncbi:type I-U CRISPR-associated protein Cas7 [Corynebacterium sp.]|uniref:type I-G CRISPR-associated protein Cas7 n=1 Tax=Corynebacterium sp. TaxID=1720 RepID=UPI0025B95947|nr:type I-U CRISPR-associated protein Cas7 [Corynebacterium sp.]